MKRKSRRASTGHGTGVLQRAPLSQMLRDKPTKRAARRILQQQAKDAIAAQTYEPPAPVGAFQPVKVTE